MGWLVTVSGGPNRLNILDPEAATLRSVTLNLPPLCVSVSPNGRYAVVGHNAYVSHIDLVAGTLLNTWSVPVLSYDIVHGGNGWAYVFPEVDQWVKVHCVNLSNGTSVTHMGNMIYDSEKGKLHPSGTALYSANNGLSPSDFEKFSVPVSGGAVSYLYDSPYHGDYAFNGDIWISDDGLRLFARSRNVFSSNPARASDMLYSGQLSGSNPLKWVEHSSAANRIYAVQFATGSFSGETQPAIYSYDPAYLTQQGSFNLPGRLGSGSLTYETQGKFLFVNSSGSRLYILGQSKPGSGILYDWCVVGYDTSTLP